MQEGLVSGRDSRSWSPGEEQLAPKEVSHCSDHELPSREVWLQRQEDREN